MDAAYVVAIAFLSLYKNLRAVRINAVLRRLCLVFMNYQRGTAVGH